MKKYVLIGSFVGLMIIIVMTSLLFFKPKEEASVSAVDAEEVDRISESEETALNNNDYITLHVINGEVIIGRDGQEITETNEIQVYAGDTVITKESSTAKGEMNSDEMFMIDENSSIEITEIIDDEKGVQIEMNQHVGLVYHMGEHDAYFVNINDIQYQPIGTHFFTSVDPETGESGLFVASGIVRSSFIPEPDRFTNVLPSQQLSVNTNDQHDTHPGIITPGELVMNMNNSMLASFIENKMKIDEENESLLELLNSSPDMRGEYGLTSDEDLDKLKENTNKLYEYILDQSIKRGHITQEEAQFLVDQFNNMVEDDRGRIDMSKDIMLHPLELENQLFDRQQERAEEERKRAEEERKRAEQQRLQEENQRIIEQIKQRVEQQKEENRLQQERAAEEAERKYLEQLSREERERLERNQEKAREKPSQPEIVRPMPPAPQPPPGIKPPSNELEEERQREEEERQREEERARLIQKIKDYLETISFESLDLSEGVKNIDLSDFYAMDERIETTVQVDGLEVAAVSIEDAQMRITPIQPGESKLVFKVGLDNTEIVKEINISVVISIPLETAISIEFMDTNPLNNAIVPEVIITKATDETYLTDYVLFWADEQNEKLGEPIITLEKTGEDIHYIFPEDIEIPTQAKGILIYSKNDFGLSNVSVYTPIVDYQAYSVGRRLNDRELIENDYSGLELSGLFIDPYGEEVDFSSQLYRVEAISSDGSVKVENRGEWIEFEGVHPGESFITLNLYYAKGKELLVSTTFNVTVRQIILPKQGPSFVDYTIVNNNEIKFTIGKAEDESDILGYYVYWSNNDNDRLGVFTAFGIMDSAMEFTIPIHYIHDTRVLVVTYNEMGESEEFAYVDLTLGGQTLSKDKLIDLSLRGGR
ncbi:hypothetical protein NC661_05775 [Aquibacillus koreensis]|uniref:FecR protein domain-containing protein n=1 Tax=Aquibacillus koreensis TaxID=279446 RepID=A0A9X4AIX9_9BACI|nr:hypothetical protein [Aquibacillus koreensis]MCT2537142.1 hypothetical protein [Aquibacillus koreensis]MDC3419875.1 hypothetical protein [Aquibacillus koreensis]